MSQEEDTGVSPAEAPEPPNLPAFVRRRAQGLFVLPAAIAAKDDFSLFIEQLCIAGFHLSGLDYSLFQHLVHEWSPQPDAEPERLADDIVYFEPARRELYKSVQVTPDGEQAEYYFEPVSIETIERTPIYEPAREDGTTEVIGWNERRNLVPTVIDADELVFDLWTKGVRYGIDYDRIRKIIAAGETGRFIVARMLEPIEGTDAGIQEVFQDLHRDNSPKRLADGRFDLRQFNNRYPQIGTGVAILKKIPRTFGKTGLTVAGKVVKPSTEPKDLSLLDLSGPGTVVETREDGEYIVAAMDGFLSVDKQSVAVTEKIINKEGISLRTTGDLKLSGDEFESEGDVQERRVVEGNNMLFHGNVYGSVLSRGGTIQIDGNIVNGKAASPGGSIVVQGRASGAEMRAVGGRIEVPFAEGSVLVASLVRIENAYSCEIIAEQVEAEHLEGCTVAASTIRINTCLNRRDAETSINVLIPGFDELKTHEKTLTEELEKLRHDLASLSGQLSELRAQPELNKYIALDMKLKKGEIKLTDQQAEQVHKAALRFVPVIRKISQLAEAQTKLKELLGRKENELEAAVNRRKQAESAVGCQLAEVAGDTSAHTLPLLPAEAVLSDPQLAWIERNLQQRGNDQVELFSGTDGSFEWRYAGAEA